MTSDETMDWLVKQMADCKGTDRTCRKTIKQLMGLYSIPVMPEAPALT